MKTYCLIGMFGILVCSILLLGHDVISHSNTPTVLLYLLSTGIIWSFVTASRRAFGNLSDIHREVGGRLYTVLCMIAFFPVYMAVVSQIILFETSAIAILQLILAAHILRTKEPVVE